MLALSWVSVIVFAVWQYPFIRLMRMHFVLFSSGSGISISFWLPSFCLYIIWNKITHPHLLLSSCVIPPITLDRSLFELDDISYHPRYWSSNNPIQWDLWIDWSLWRCFPFLGTAYHVSGYHPISCCRVLSDHVSLSTYLPTILYWIRLHPQVMEVSMF